jgi:hypothetical protein
MILCDYVKQCKSKTNTFIWFLFFKNGKNVISTWEGEIS